VTGQVEGVECVLSRGISARGEGRFVGSGRVRAATGRVAGLLDSGLRPAG
jgi:hypothetical protein